MFWQSWQVLFMNQESEKGKQKLFSAEIYVEVVNDFIKHWFDEYKKLGIRKNRLI